MAFDPPRHLLWEVEGSRNLNWGVHPNYSLCRGRSWNCYSGKMTTRDEANRKVAAEMVRFRQALPSLLAGPYAGDWVVFLDGKVKFAHHDRAIAYHWALKEVGVMAGFVLAQVAPERVARIGGARRRMTAL